MRLLLCALLLVAAPFGSTQEDEDVEGTYISHQDLMAAGSEQFSSPGVSSFGPLLFDVARDQLFVGARDNLFRLSLRGLQSLERALWSAPREKVQLCQDKGQSEDSCRNYVKVLLSDGMRLFTCGTSAFSPACSWRQLDNVSNVLEMVHGVAKCPYDPRANITALMTMEGQYYVGTPTDFSGSDYAVYRALGAGLTLRTSQYNSQWLNEPQFVGSFEDEMFVYFVFREPAVEFINCGKRVYSRIARVCKNDAGGGQMVLRENWTTFVKARLNCSEPGEYPFYYDEVQSIEYLPQQRILYAAFTTPSNSIAGSAICMFNMSAIEDTFRGSFKHQENPGSAWESRPARHHTHTHCRSQSETSRTQQLAESSRYQLMDGAVQPTSPRPLHSAALQRFSLLTVAVLSHQHLIFVATLDGLVKKLAVLPDRQETCVIENWKPEVGNAPIKAMQYLKETDSVYLGTEAAVLRISAAHCARWASRGACLGAQDPQCGWDERRELCTTAPPAPHPHWLQETPACPRKTSIVDGGWSAWSAWEQCLQAEEGGSREDGGEDRQDKCLCQSRHCDSPPPRGGGRRCGGATIRVSNCTQHGQWTAWSGWSACSASCGVAVKWRRRSCGAPAPAHGGRLCVGTDRQEIYCTQNPPCPAPVVAVVEAAWGEWGAWSPCSAACGGGARWRSRSCDSPAPSPGAAPCPGCATLAEPCNLQPCDTRRTSAWSPWITLHPNGSDHSIVEKRYKFTCRVQGMDSVKVFLSKEEERPWAQGETAGTEGWGPWEGWGACTAECGGGQQWARRRCLAPPCEGSPSAQRACNTHSCMDGWGCWSEWSDCSVSCGSGRSERRRPCLLSGGCQGSPLQLKHCQGPPCQEAVGWGEWSEWSACEGEEEQRRWRTCERVHPVCLGPPHQVRPCLYTDNDTDNELHALAARRPVATVVMASSSGIGEGSGGIWWALVGTLFCGLLLGGVLCFIILEARRRRRATRIPSSPHYMTQQNSYVSVPLKEVPKKRQPSFSGTSPGGLGPAKANNLNSDRGTPKLYPKAITGDYEGATMKRNSNAPLRNNINLEQEKFN